MMLSSEAAGVYLQKSPVPSAQGLPDRRKLSCEAVSGILPVSDSRFLVFLLNGGWGARGGCGGVINV